MYPNNSTSSAVNDTIKINFNITMCLSVLIVITNSIPIWIIISTRTIRRDMSNKYLVNLWLSHVVVGLFSIVVTIILFVINNSIKWALFTGSASITTSFALITFTVDKFVCIKYPFHHQNLPNWLSYLVMLFCWIIGAIHLVIGEIFSSVSDMKNMRLTFLGTGCAVLVVLLVCNALIFKELRRHIKAISASITSNIVTINISVVPNNNIANTADYDLSSTTDLRKGFIKKKEIRAAYVCIYMATSYTIFWIPFFVVSFVSDLNTPTNLGYTIYVGAINSIADPVIYICFNKRVRTTITKRLTHVSQNS